MCDSYVKFPFRNSLSSYALDADYLGSLTITGSVTITGTISHTDSLVKITAGIGNGLQIEAGKNGINIKNTSEDGIRIGTVEAFGKFM